MTSSGNRKQHGASKKEHKFVDLDVPYDFTCRLCDKKFEKAKPYSTHMKHDHRTLPFQCEVCNEEFQFHKAYSYHFIIRHGFGKFSCEYCLRRFKFVRSVTKHILEEHSHFVGSVKCATCPLTFKVYSDDREGFGKHYRECMRSVFAKYEKRKNGGFDKGEEPHSCHHCGKTFRTPFGRDNHVRRYHEHSAELRCDQCGYQAGWQKELNKHKVRHHILQDNRLVGEVPEELKGDIFQCKQCPLVYAERPHLLRHVMSEHDKMKRLWCPHPNCGRDFKWKVQLKRHIASNHPTL